MEITVKLKDENKGLTFGDVPIGSAFIDYDGDLCLKINSLQYVFFHEGGISCLYEEDDDGEEIERIVNKLEITEVEP